MLSFWTTKSKKKKKCLRHHEQENNILSLTSIEVEVAQVSFIPEQNTTILYISLRN